MRKLVSIRTISNIFPIDGADMIEAIQLDGWVCVAKKGEFKIGDFAVYFEIDSFLPLSDERFKFLAKNGFIYNEIMGVKIRTIKLRKQISQGLAMPLSMFPEFSDITEETDLSEILGVVKWETSIHSSLNGIARGNFPSFLIKTDEIRIQNIFNEIPRDILYEVSMKIDGSSMTVYHNDGLVYENENTFGVCSRNIDLIDVEGNAYWNMAHKLDLKNKMTKLGRNLAIQGELWGNNINGNWEKIDHNEFSVFRIWDIDKQCFLNFDEKMQIVKEFNLQHVPIIETRYFDFADIKLALEYAKGSSIYNKIREGIVFKSINGTFSFKIINNEFLLKNIQ